MLKYEKLTQDNIKELIPVMKSAFDDDAQRFQGLENGGPPGYDDGSFLKKWGLESNSQSCVIRNDEKAVGAFIVFWKQDGGSILGNIFVEPAHQNIGIGSKVWAYIKEKYKCKSWRLETVAWATRNHHFYEKLGFEKSKIDGDFVEYKMNCEQDVSL